MPIGGIGGRPAFRLPLDNYSVSSYTVIMVNETAAKKSVKTLDLVTLTTGGPQRIAKIVKIDGGRRYEIYTQDASWPLNAAGAVDLIHGFTVWPARAFWAALAASGNVVTPAPVAKPKRVTVALKCNECGKKFRVSPKAIDTDCPKCGGVDWDVVDDLIG